MEYLYHYTSVDTFALILKNKTVCFNNLLYVDDIEEAETNDMDQFGKFVYVSCWTDADQESIPLWNMYTPNMSGVRIKMLTMPFKKHHYKKGEYFLKEDVDTYINLHEVFANDKYSLTLDQPRLMKVIYTNDENKIYPTVRKEEHQGDVTRFLSASSTTEVGTANVTYSFKELGLYKRECWSFQKEWRYIINIAPMGLKEQNPATFQKQQEYIRRVEDRKSQPPCKKLFLEIEDSAFNNMEITLGPKISLSNRIIIESLLSKYNPSCCVHDSTLKIR